MLVKSAVLEASHSRWISDFVGYLRDQNTCCCSWRPCSSTRLVALFLNPAPSALACVLLRARLWQTFIDAYGFEDDKVYIWGGVAFTVVEFLLCAT